MLRNQSMLLMLGYPCEGETDSNRALIAWTLTAIPDMKGSLSLWTESQILAVVATGALCFCSPSALYYTSVKTTQLLQESLDGDAHSSYRLKCLRYLECYAAKSLMLGHPCDGEPDSNGALIAWTLTAIPDMEGVTVFMDREPDSGSCCCYRGAVLLYCWGIVLLERSDEVTS